MSNLAQDTTKSAKSLAQAIAKQMAQEPLEVLKSAKSQVSGEQISSPDNQPRMQESTNSGREIEDQNKLQDKMKSTRRMEALNRELEDIQKQDLFKDLQARIARGEEIPIDDYQGLSVEQKQVLKAQMEAVKVQMAMQNQTQKTLVEPGAKKGRQLFNFGKKTAMKREQTHVEKVVPPSG